MRRHAPAVMAVLATLVVLYAGTAQADRIAEWYALAEGAHPYWVPERAVQLYLLWPTLSVATLCAFLAPGVLAVRGARVARGMLPSIALGFLASLGLAVALRLAFGVAQVPPTRLGFLGAWLAATVVAGTAASLRGPRGGGPIREDLRRALTILGAWFVLSAALVPKLFWEDLSSDGVEAFEFGRSLLRTPLPSFDLHEGTFGFYQNFFAFAYVNHWFVQALGATEVAARLPFLLYLGLTYVAVLLIVEDAQPRRLRGAEELLLLAGVLLYGYVQAYSSTYEPYHTDLAEPSATDSLWSLGFLLSAWALFAGRKLAFVASALLCHASSGGGLLLLIMLGVAVRVGAPELRRHFRLVVITIGLALLLALLHRVLYIEVLLDGVKDQLGGENLLRRLWPPQLFEWGRWNLLLFPSGLLPALALLWVRPARHPRAFALALVTLGYFGVIYVQAWCGTHQFTPVMILPLAVFWRWYLTAPDRAPRVLGALAVTTGVAFVASTPRHFELSTGVRAIGLATEVRVGDYWADLRTVAPTRSQLFHLLPQDYRILYPYQPWGADPYAWLHYAHRAKPEDQAIAYVVQAAASPDVEDARREYEAAGFETFVLDIEAWRTHRRPGQPRQVVSPIYDAPLIQSFSFFREVSDMEHPEAPVRLPLPPPEGAPP